MTEVFLDSIPFFLRLDFYSGDDGWMGRWSRSEHEPLGNCLARLRRHRLVRRILVSLWIPNSVWISYYWTNAG